MPVRKKFRRLYRKQRKYAKQDIWCACYGCLKFAHRRKRANTMRPLSQSHDVLKATPENAVLRNHEDTGGPSFYWHVPSPDWSTAD